MNSKTFFDYTLIKILNNYELFLIFLKKNKILK